MKSITTLQGLFVFFVAISGLLLMAHRGNHSHDLHANSPNHTHTHDHDGHTHGHDVHTHGHDGHTHDHGVVVETPHATQAKLVTGQGDFVFSWDEGLTGAFPEEAREFEPAMHGGFNEDPETGVIYTGIPGYGLCSISADLKTWTKIGSDERLKDNIHGIVFFVHKGKKHLAVAQEGKRVLVLNIDGSIISDILKPSGDEFDFLPANDFLWFQRQ